MPHVILEDQTLRDGLQIEKRLFSLQEKIDIIDGLIAAGLTRIQIGSFVHPQRVPQMADTDALVKALGVREGVVFTGLVLNRRGLERAMACGLSNVALSVSVSDTHSRKNANRSAQEALKEMITLIAEAVAAGVGVRAGLQCCFGCVYEGHIDEDAVLAAATQMATAGAGEINLADTTGMANPRQIESLCRKVAESLPEVSIILHLHDTRGLGMANLIAAYDIGIRYFDVCTGGLGGCPFVKGAAGNVPTEDAVYALESLGGHTGIDLNKLIAVTEMLEDKLQRELPARMGRVVRFASNPPTCS
jgi:hydroxymethylglutaryl-CoA lyase